MNDRMYPLSFDALMRWALASAESIFGVNRPFRANPARALPIFGETLEMPIGPAAGPHTQLSQNIVCAYAAGARFFELKTVQTLDGEDLPVEKPCILAADEGYNVEWSTELTVAGAMREYIHAWVALKLLSRARGLGGENGFVFNMSVGYDLAGIQSGKIDSYLESMRDASRTEAFLEAIDWARAHMALLPEVDGAFIDSISPRVCGSVTLSTLHGCPPEEIERIASYLLAEKGFHTFVKCNPTLLGYAFARKTMDAMGYDAVAFDDHHFRNDLQYEDAVPMLGRLQALADEKGLAFGVKLTNTFPVRITAGELPGEEMYMSGRPLFALATALAARLSETFGGALRISFSGGADAWNVPELYDAGIWPITVATTLLKPGGYGRLVQMAEALAAKPAVSPDRVDVQAIRRIAKGAAQDVRYAKPLKAVPRRKMNEKVPLLDCFAAPCSGGCPIHQDVPEYIRLAGKGDYLGALEVITRDNPLPFITGTLCNHRCQSRCRRGDYDETVHIRAVKLLAAERAIDALLAGITPPKQQGPKVAVIGGGAAGLSAAYFLARGGADVTIFEKRAALGGVVRSAIPSFRIDDAAIDRDISLILSMGVKVRLDTAVTDIAPLRAEGFRYFVLAVGAQVRGSLPIGTLNAICAIDFLEAFRLNPQGLPLGKTVAVVGGGNTAMDTARAALRVPGVEQVRIVYRRDVRNMPADEEELLVAQAEGVLFEPLLGPCVHEGGVLRCNRMALGAPDESGRRRPVKTGAMEDIRADTVLLAIGEQVDEAFYRRLGVDDRTYIIGDGANGPATVVEAIADARRAADAILEKAAMTMPTRADVGAGGRTDAARAKKGRLMAFTKDANEVYRCLSCDAVCECCVDVCPNRANITMDVQGRPQIVHIDRLCNACGNCETFCPYDSAPYKEKFTYFSRRVDFDKSDAPGVCWAGDTPLVRAPGDVRALVAAVDEKLRALDR